MRRFSRRAKKRRTVLRRPVLRHLLRGAHPKLNSRAKLYAVPRAQAVSSLLSKIAPHFSQRRTASRTLRLFLGAAAFTLAAQAAVPSASFDAPQSYLVDGPPGNLAVADFNGDGILDLVVAIGGRIEGGNVVLVLMGRGDGTFHGPVSYPAGGSAVFVAVGDFNRDGKADLAVIANAGISILLGNGDGTFQPAVAYPVGSTPVSLALGDFNGDGKTDLVVANSGSDNVSVLLGNGDGTFQRQCAVAYVRSWRSLLTS